MEAIISELWNTGIDIITTENDANEIQSISDLRKCDNVLVGKRNKDRWHDETEMLIDDDIVYVTFREVSHPSGCGRLQVCQVI